MPGNQENTCSESVSCAGPVEPIRLSLSFVRLFYGCTSMQFIGLTNFLPPGHGLYSGPSEPMSRGGAAMANADEETNQLLPRFLLPAV